MTWTPSDVIAVLGAIGVLATTIFTLIKQLKSEKKVEEIKDLAVVTKDLAIVGDKKFDNITMLVDGRYGDVLEELAVVKRLLATKTKSVRHEDEANKAEEKFDKQKALVDQAHANQTENVKESDEAKDSKEK